MRRMLLEPKESTLQLKSSLCLKRVGLIGKKTKGDQVAERRCSVTRRQKCPNWKRRAIGAFTGAAWFGSVMIEDS